MLLAIDTSTRTVGLALYDGEQVLGESIWTGGDFHTVELAPAVNEMIKRCGVSMDSLEALGVALGPGSFTGLRIGLALAKGLALVRGLSMVGIPTLDVLAAGQTAGDLPLAAVLRAGRGRLAVGWYQPGPRGWRTDGKLEVLTPEELADRIETPTLVAGELEEDARRLLGRKRKIVILASPAHSLRHPGFLAELAWKRLQAGQVDDPATLSPIYLHTNEPIPG